jgi:hypothetical protein
MYYQLLKVIHCISACPYKPADLIFLLDGSGSEGAANFKRQLQFVSNFTKQFEIGSNNTRVALTSFGTTVHNEFFLNQYTDNASVLNHINNAKYPDGETNTHLGKRLSLNQLNDQLINLSANHYAMYIHV